MLRRLLPHTWYWWLWFSVVPVFQGLVIRTKSSFMREARTGLVILLFSVYFFICLCLMVLCHFLLSVRKNSSPPSITYCAFWFASHPSHVVCTFSCLFSIPCAILLSVWQFLLAQFHMLATSPIFGSHIAHVLMQNAYRRHLAVPWALQNTYILLLVTPPLDILKIKVGILIIFWLIQLWFLGVADLCFATPAYLQRHPLPSDLFFCGTAWL